MLSWQMAPGALLTACPVLQVMSEEPQCCSMLSGMHGTHYCTPHVLH